MNIDVFYAHKAGSLKATLQGIQDWFIQSALLFPITDDLDRIKPFIVALRAHIYERLAVAESEARAFANSYAKEKEVA